MPLSELRCGRVVEPERYATQRPKWRRRPATTENGQAVRGHPLSSSSSAFASLRSGCRAFGEPAGHGLKTNSSTSAAFTTPRRVKVDSIMAYFGLSRRQSPMDSWSSARPSLIPAIPRELMVHRRCIEPEPQIRRLGTNLDSKGVHVNYPNASGRLGGSSGMALQGAGVGITELPTPHSKVLRGFTDGRGDCRRPTKDQREDWLVTFDNDVSKQDLGGASQVA